MKKRTWAFINAFHGAETATTASEYATILSVVVIAVIVSLMMLGQSTRMRFHHMRGEIEATGPVQGGYGGVHTKGSHATGEDVTDTSSPHNHDDGAAASGLGTERIPRKRTERRRVRDDSVLRLVNR